MKQILCTLAALFCLSTSADDRTFICKTQISHDGYYVKKLMKLILLKPGSIWLNTFNEDTREWEKGSFNERYTIKKAGWISYSGFDSDDLFGDLSEGAADKGITLYMSPEVSKGRIGKVYLYASGTEAGFEKGSYTCQTTKK